MSEQWGDMTVKLNPYERYFFYDDQTGNEFIDYGDTDIPYTYYRLYIYL